MPRPPLWYLQKVDLFKGMTDAEMMEMIPEMIDKTFPCKHILYTPQEELTNAFILKEGEVTLYQAVNGKKVVIDILKPGAIFGNILFNPENQRDGHYAEVSQDSYICILPQDFFMQMTQKRPDIALNALKSLSQRLSQYQTQLKLMSLLSAKDRILATVKLLNEQEDRSILPQILRMPTKITHEKLANMTGLTRETVTKQLQELDNEGMLTIHKKHIRLTEIGREKAAAVA